jgi:hypothetical protein
VLKDNSKHSAYDATPKLSLSAGGLLSTTFHASAGGLQAYLDVVVPWVPWLEMELAYAKILGAGSSNGESQRLSIGRYEAGANGRLSTAYGDLFAGVRAVVQDGPRSFRWPSAYGGGALWLYRLFIELRIGVGDLPTINGNHIQLWESLSLGWGFF